MKIEQRERWIPKIEIPAGLDHKQGGGSETPPKHLILQISCERLEGFGFH